MNSEFRPFLRMTFPAGTSDLTAGWQPGKKLLRSWILLLGVVPIEYDDLAFEEVEPGRRFLERSVLLTQRLWEHERIIEQSSSGSRVTDRVSFTPRLPWLGPFNSRIFKAVFRWRHRNLRKHFGER